MRFDQAKHDYIIGHSINTKYSVCTAVEFPNSIFNRATKDLSTFQRHTEISPFRGPFKRLSVQYECVRDCCSFSEVEASRLLSIETMSHSKQ